MSFSVFNSSNVFYSKVSEYSLISGSGISNTGPTGPAGESTNTGPTGILDPEENLLIQDQQESLDRLVQQVL